MQRYINQRTVRTGSDSARNMRDSRTATVLAQFEAMLFGQRAEIARRDGKNAFARGEEKTWNMTSLGGARGYDWRRLRRKHARTTEENAAAKQRGRDELGGLAITCTQQCLLDRSNE